LAPLITVPINQIIQIPLLVGSYNPLGNSLVVCHALVDDNASYPVAAHNSFEEVG
jgi:hypothetical protein